MRLWRSLALVVAALVSLPNLVHADEPGEQALDSLDAVHDACRIADGDPGRELYAMAIEADWQFGALDGSGALRILPHRNFRALAGRVELIPSRMEPVVVEATPRRVDELEVARSRGARLYLGFFLGFDEPERRACIARSRFAVTTLRADIAYVELRGPDGAVLAREDTSRLVSWREQREEARFLGEPARAVIEEPSSNAGTLPDLWKRQIRAASDGPVGRALEQCYGAAERQGITASARVVVMARMDARSGLTLETSIALSDIPDGETVECVRGAFRALAVTPIGEGRPIELLVPVRFVDGSTGSSSR